MQILGLNLPYLSDKKGSGGGGVPPANTPIDDIGDAIYAVSVRRVISTYSGSCLRVRRESDNAEEDIGFDGSGNLDTGAVASFCGASVGRVVTWYDQSTSGIDLSQSVATRQPEIYNGTSVRTAGGRSSLFFRGDDATTANRSRLESTPTVPQLTDDPMGTDRPYLVYGVFQRESRTVGVTRERIFSILPSASATSSNVLMSLALRSDVVNSSINVINSLQLASVIGGLTDSAGNFSYMMITHDETLSPKHTARWKNTQISSSSAARPSDDYMSLQTHCYIGADGSGSNNAFKGYISEVILFDGSKNSSITDLNTYIENYYTISVDS